MVHSLSYTVLNKEVGETPLEALRRWKELHPAYQDVPASYAGRLDPMASGKLLILLGDECKKQSKYTGLDKEYQIEVLLDVSSDTGDVLGIITPSNHHTAPSLLEIKEALATEVGTHLRTYPRYSSKTVNGKPLFLYALEGTIESIEIPTHLETIYKIQLLNVGTVSTHELHTRVDSMLDKAPTSNEPSKALGADFRINKVRASWKEIIQPRTYSVLTLLVTCGTGVYMRTLVDRIALSLGTKGLALSIHRTRIGKYLQPFGFFWKEYK